LILDLRSRTKTFVSELRRLWSPHQKPECHRCKWARKISQSFWHPWLKKCGSSVNPLTSLVFINIPISDSSEKISWLFTSRGSCQILQENVHDRQTSVNWDNLRAGIFFRSLLPLRQSLCSDLCQALSSTACQQSGNHRPARTFPRFQERLRSATCKETRFPLFLLLLDGCQVMWGDLQLDFSGCLVQ